MSKSIQSLNQLYTKFETELPISKSDGSDSCDLARFNGNKNKSIHRWFVFKEGFSSDLVDWVSNQYDLDLDRMEYILDPFCGVGTSLLSIQLGYRRSNHLELVGVERNPFIASVARAKLNWNRYRVPMIESKLKEIVDLCSHHSYRTYAIPQLSTIQNPRTFSATTLYDILHTREVVDKICHGTIERQFFQLGWSAAIQPSSGIRRYGRGLRFTRTPRASFRKKVATQWKMMLDDLKEAHKHYAINDGLKAQVIAGDGRTLQNKALTSKHFDLIIYSPPYPNNIDYSEVYKMELFFSGFVNSQDELRKLRLQTFRSHPSIRFADTNYLDNVPDSDWSKRLVKSLLEAVPSDEWRLLRRRLIQGYADDLYIALQRQFDVAKQGALVVCVTGNSLHGKEKHAFCIATDLLASAIASAVGFTVRDLRILRPIERQRGTNPFLRESIVVLQRPN